MQLDDVPIDYIRYWISTSGCDATSLPRPKSPTQSKHFLGKMRTLLTLRCSCSRSYRIIKRRIAWVIGKWHALHTSPSSNPQVWEILLHLMKDHGPSSDPVVRFSASEALRQCIDVGQSRCLCAYNDIKLCNLECWI